MLAKYRQMRLVLFLRTRVNLNQSLKNEKYSIHDWAIQCKVENILGMNHKFIHHLTQPFNLSWEEPY